MPRRRATPAAAVGGRGLQQPAPGSVSASTRCRQAHRDRPLHQRQRHRHRRRTETAPAPWWRRPRSRSTAGPHCNITAGAAFSATVTARSTPVPPPTPNFGREVGAEGVTLSWMPARSPRAGPVNGNFSAAALGRQPRGRQQRRWWTDRGRQGRPGGHARQRQLPRQRPRLPPAPRAAPVPWDSMSPRLSTVPARPAAASPTARQPFQH